MPSDRFLKDKWELSPKCELGVVFTQMGPNFD